MLNFSPRIRLGILIKKTMYMFTLQPQTTGCIVSLNTAGVYVFNEIRPRASTEKLPGEAQTRSRIPQKSLPPFHQWRLKGGTEHAPPGLTPRKRCINIKSPT